ncbi:MAG: hypothetical protein AB1485_03135 [Candidatus Thermoplasmatota archaeon]
MTSTELRSKWFLLIPVIAILYTIWVVLLALGKTLGYAKAYEFWGFEQWLYLGSVLFIILIVVMIIWMAPPKKEEVKEEVSAVIAEERPPVIIEAEPLPAMPEQQKIIEYPQGIEGAVYADTFIELDKTTILNLRTFIGRSCLLCPTRNECLEEYKEKIKFEDFISSVDCFKAKVKLVAG